MTPALPRRCRALGALGASFMITPSRRTHARLLAVTEEATRAFPRILWNGEGANPYPQFLAHADAFVVTADSVNMTGEASATGRPVYVFTPSAGSDKFRRFHAALQAHGATRPLPDNPDGVPAWSYEPLQSAETIAREIERRWNARAGHRPMMQKADAASYGRRALCRRHAVGAAAQSGCAGLALCRDGAALRCRPVRRRSRRARL